MVDAGLSSHARIDLCHQRSGHLNEGNASLIDGCGKSRQISDHTASKGYQERLSLEAMADHRVENIFDRLKGFRPFPRWKNNGGGLDPILADYTED